MVVYKSMFHISSQSFAPALFLLRLHLFPDHHFIKAIWTDSDKQNVLSLTLQSFYPQWNILKFLSLQSFFSLIQQNYVLYVCKVVIIPSQEIQ